MATRKFQTLQTEIKKRSRNKQSYDEARKEWQYVSTSSSPGGVCLCTHTPITDHNKLENIFTEKTVEVGNVCVCQFVEGYRRGAGKSLESLRKEGPQIGRASKSLLEWMKEISVLDEEQFTTYYATKRRGKRLNEDQQRALLAMNLLILQATDDKRPNCQCNPSLPARLETSKRQPQTASVLFYKCGKLPNKCQLSVLKNFTVN